MTAENRIPQTTCAKGKKPSKAMASCTSAGSDHKSLVPVSSTKFMKGSQVAKSSSTSSSDSESGRRSLRGGNGTINRKMSQGMKEDLELATLSISECSLECSLECSSDTNSSYFEASNMLPLKCLEPDETKGMTTTAEPAPRPQSKDLDVVNSSLAVNWFSLGDDDFDDLLKTKVDQNSDTAASEIPILPSCYVEAVDSPDPIPDADNRQTDESHGEDAQGNSITTSPQDKKSEEEQVVGDIMTRTKTTPEVQECSQEKNDSQQAEGQPAPSEKSEGTSEASTLERSQLAKASGRLPHLEGYGIYAFRNSQRSRVLLASLFFLLTTWLSVRKWTDEDLVLPPT